MEELERDIFDFSVEFSAEDIIDYDSLEKCNEFESIEIALEKNEVDESVYVGFVPLTFMNQDNIPLARMDVVPKQPFVCARCNQFYKYELFFQKHVESCGK